MAMCSLRSGGSAPGPSPTSARTSDATNKPHRCSNLRVAPLKLEVRGRQIQLTQRRHGKDHLKFTSKRSARSFGGGGGGAHGRLMTASTSNSQCNSRTSFDESLQRYVEDSYNMTYGRHIELLNKIIVDPQGTSASKLENMDTETSNLLDEHIVEKMEGITLDHLIKPSIKITSVSFDVKNSSVPTDCESMKSEDSDPNYLTVPILASEMDELPKCKQPES